MKQLMENFRAFINEEPLTEQSTAAIYKFLGLPQYLGNAAIGTGMFRNKKFMQDFTAEEVTSREFESSVDKMDPKKLRMLVDAAQRFEEETGKTVAAAVISPSFCSPGSHDDCDRGVCKGKLQEFEFSTGGKCVHKAGGNGLNAPGVVNFIWFISCSGLAGKEAVPQGAVRSLILTLAEGNKLKFVPGGGLKTNDFLGSLNIVKRILFKNVEAKTEKSDIQVAKTIYTFSPYGKAENRCKEIFQPGLQPAPFGIIDKDERFGFGDDRVWNFKCVDKNNVKLINTKEIMSRIGKKGFAGTKELPKCDQKQKTCKIKVFK